MQAANGAVLMEIMSGSKIIFANKMIKNDQSREQNVGGSNTKMLRELL